jgi:uncharacterized protein
MKKNHNATHKIALKEEGRILFPQADVANTFTSRIIGLLRYAAIPGDYALLFPDCRSLHTFFMRFPIDIAFLSHDFRVVEIHPRIPPGRLVTNRNRQGRHALEALADTFEHIHLKTRQHLEVLDA